MKTEDLIKWALVGAAGLYVWRSGMLDNLLGIPTAPQVPAGGQQPVAQLPAGSQPADGDGAAVQPAGSGGGAAVQPSVQSILEKMAAWAGSTPMNWDQWNYGYQISGGSGQPKSPEDVGLTRTEPMPTMTLQEWSSLNQDLPGVSLSGLGRVDPRVVNLGRMLVNTQWLT